MSIEQIMGAKPGDLFEIMQAAVRSVTKGKESFAVFLKQGEVLLFLGKSRATFSLGINYRFLYKDGYVVTHIVSDSEPEFDLLYLTQLYRICQ